LAFDFAPPEDCPLCPRLADFRADNRLKFPHWRNAPVPSFGSEHARLAIVGLAPGLRGANRTGRPFTGDYAGDLLYATLLEIGFATGVYEQRADDSLTLIGCAILNSVRCVPPLNKPTPIEIATCRRFLAGTLAALKNLEIIVALGRIAHESLLRLHGSRLARFPFAHGAVHAIGEGLPTIVDSYHCSRYNTNTGVLTTEMFRAVFATARTLLDKNRAPTG
jgi:uracil-DNA glycosylase family 4